MRIEGLSRIVPITPVSGVVKKIEKTLQFVGRVICLQHEYVFFTLRDENGWNSGRGLECIKCGHKTKGAQI